MEHLGFGEKPFDGLKGGKSERDKRDKEAKKLKPESQKAADTSKLLESQDTTRTTQKKMSKDLKPLKTPPAVPVPYSKPTEKNILKPTKKNIHESLDKLNDQLEALKSEAFKIMDPKKQTLDNLLETHEEFLPVFQQYHLDFLNMKKLVDAGDDKLKKNPEILQKIQELSAPIKAMERYRSQLKIQTFTKKAEGKVKADEEQRNKAEIRAKFNQAIAMGDAKLKAGGQQMNPSFQHVPTPLPTSAPSSSPTQLPPPESLGKPPAPPSRRESPPKSKHATPEPARKESEPRQLTKAESAQAAEETDPDAIKTKFDSKMKEWRELHLATFIKDTKFKKTPEDLKILKEKSPILYALYNEIIALADKIPNELSPEEDGRLNKMHDQIKMYIKYIPKT